MLPREVSHLFEAATGILQQSPTHQNVKVIELMMKTEGTCGLSKTLDKFTLFFFNSEILQLCNFFLKPCACLSKVVKFLEKWKVEWGLPDTEGRKKRGHCLMCLDSDL